jgi:hypothetical protein
MSNQDDPGVAPASPGNPASEQPSATARSTPALEINLAQSPELDNPKAVGNELKTVANQGPSGDGSSNGDVQTKPYDNLQARDRTREIVTLWLIGLLCVIVVLSFVGLFARGMYHRFDEDFFKELKQVIDVLVGPVITLLSSAVGFYFGYQQGAANEKSNTSDSTT